MQQILGKIKYKYIFGIISNQNIAKIAASFT